MRFDILSLFPEMLKGAFGYSIVKRAQEKGLVQINLVDIQPGDVPITYADVSLLSRDVG